MSISSDRNGLKGGRKVDNRIISDKTVGPHSMKEYLKRYSVVKKLAAWRWSITEVVSLEIYHWKMFLLGQIPGKIGSFVRKKTLGFRKCGSDVFIMHHAWFKMPQNISIGDDVRIHNMTYIDASGGLEIGSHIGITAGCQIYTQNHGINRNELYYYQPYRLGKVVIEDDCWIGAGSTITAGVTIRKGTIVGAGSVITKDTEAYSIVGGVPAKKIGERPSKMGNG
jgi:acetyltransferase-like isoleucine patch superfamily enzyme